MSRPSCQLCYFALSTLLLCHYCDRVCSYSELELFTSYDSEAI